MRVAGCVYLLQVNCKVLYDVTFQLYVVKFNLWFVIWLQMWALDRVIVIKKISQRIRIVFPRIIHLKDVKVGDKEVESFFNHNVVGEVCWIWITSLQC